MSRFGISPLPPVAVDAAAAVIARAASGAEAIYGVNTGFGKLASVRIAAADTAQLQRNLILSHCCGVGEPLEPETVRLMMALKLMSLGRGASGVRWPILAQIEAMIRAQKGFRRSPAGSADAQRVSTAYRRLGDPRDRRRAKGKTSMR